LLRSGFPLQGGGRLRGSPFVPEVVFDAVMFTYPGAATPVLAGLSFRIAPGETVAIVGANGAGKSTLAKLLAGFYAPTCGRITLSGVDLRELSGDDLRKRIAFVFQDFGHFAASVSDNIAYGDWPRLASDRAAVERVARLAGLSDAVAKMPHQYDTLLGRQFGEVEPSGGTWQKIAIARALARDAPLLVLDEPTASVDVRSELEVFCRLRELAQGRTTVLISHRFSTVKMADRILVLEDGRSSSRVRTRRSWRWAGDMPRPTATTSGRWIERRRYPRRSACAAMWTGRPNQRAWERTSSSRIEPRTPCLSRIFRRSAIWASGARRVNRSSSWSR